MILALNKRVSWPLLRRYGARDALALDYPRVVEEQCAGNKTVVDVGAGRKSLFARNGARLIAIDISSEQLAANHETSERLVSDATKSIPLSDATVDVLTSHCVIEHMRGVDDYIAHAHRVLKPGGLLITAFPNKWALPSIINRLLPHDVKRRVLFALKPESKADLGFRTFFEHCTPAAFQRLVVDRGFDVVRVENSYFQADYFDSLFPICAAVCVYDRVLERLGLSALCASTILVARKR